MPHPRFGNVTIDCNEVTPLVAFWTEAFGYEVEEQGEDWALLRDPHGRSPKIFFQPVPEPKTVKNRVHIDFYVADREAEAERLKALGARELWRPDIGFPTVVLADPAGNELCLSEVPSEALETPFG